MLRKSANRLRDLSAEFVRRLREGTLAEVPQRRMPLAEALEDRRMFSTQTATLIVGGDPAQNNDGSLTVTVDPYGSFGDRFAASGAVFNPPGGRRPQETINTSALFFGPISNFLTTDTIITNNTPMPDATFISQTTNSAHSVFTIVGTDGITYRIDLVQQLAPFDSDNSRTTLTQTYTITNMSAVDATGVVLSRYLSSDQNWDGSAFDDDHGGRSGDGRILFAFDSKSESTSYVSVRNDDVEFKPNITAAYHIAEGFGNILDNQNDNPTMNFLNGTFKPETYWPTMLQSGGIAHGNTLTFTGFVFDPVTNTFVKGPQVSPPVDDIDTFPNDQTSPPDRLDDAGTNSGGPTTLVVQDTYGTLAAGQSITYTTRTDWGQLNDSFGHFLSPGVFDIDGPSLDGQSNLTLEPVGDPAKGATGAPAIITITRDGHLGAADIGIRSNDLEAISFFPNGAAPDYQPLSAIDPATGLVAFDPTTGQIYVDPTTGRPTGYASLHFQDGETKKTIGLMILPDLQIEGDERIFVGMYHFPANLLNPLNQPNFRPFPGTVPLHDITANALSSTPTFWDVGQKIKGEPDNPVFINLHIAANDQPGTINFSTSGYTIGEGAGTEDIEIDRTGGDPSAEVSVNFAITDGTATLLQDYGYPINLGPNDTFDPVTGTGTIRFLIGETQHFIHIPILDDFIDEQPGEAFNISLSAVAPALTGTINTASVFIADNDNAGTLSFLSPTFAVNEGDGTASVTVVRTGGSDGPVSFTLTTGGVGDTATKGADYTDETNTYTMAPGVTSAVISIPIVDDNLNEPNEGISLSLSNISAGVIGSPAAATLTIVDNDFGALVQAASTIFTARESAGSSTITITRTTNLDSAITVDYATVVGGSAISGTDYTPTSGTLTFDVGQTSATFSVQLIDDNVLDGTKTVDIALSNPSALAQLGDPATATLVISDNDSGMAFSAAAYTVNENAGTVTLTVKRAGDLTAPVTIDYATSDGTAHAGTDYTASTGTVSFAAGESTKTLTVPIIDNANDVQSARSFNVTLSNPQGDGAQLGSQTTATVTVNDVERSHPVVTNMQMVIPTVGLERIVLTFSKTLDPLSANLPGNYSIRVLDSKGRLGKAVRVSAATYNPTNNTVTLLPLPTLAKNKVYQVGVKGFGGVADKGGRYLAATALGTSADFSGRVGFGTKLTYADHDGNLVTLAVKKGAGFMYNLFGSTDSITLFGVRPGITTLTGSVKRQGFSDGSSSISIHDKNDAIINLSDSFDIIHVD